MENSNGFGLQLSLPWNKVPIINFKLLPNLLIESTELRSAEHGQQDFILADPPIIITWLPGGSAKTRPAGHRRGRPPRTSGEHLWRILLISFYDGRGRGRPPCSVAKTLLLPRAHRPKGHRRGRPPNNYLSSSPNPIYPTIGHSFSSILCYPHVKEDAQRLRPGESTMAREASVEDNNAPILHDSFRQRPEDIATFGNGHFATWCSFSSSSFCNFIYKKLNSSHVSLRRDIFVASLFREV